MPMNPDLRAHWLTALRSDDFLQGTGRFKTLLANTDQPGYCCLGVLLHVAAEHDLLPDGYHIAEHDYALQTWIDAKNAGSSSLLPKDGADFGFPIGTCFRSAEGALAVNAHTKLTTMNDSGKTFAEIADWIEANLP